ncbi:UDP-glucuronosyl/UDP-glucosyltransferase [Parasponia andersonii]|uniref:UDP-glucuronosyl/UDP-glucosyltransferase n=1 Tax=Parasponia andersonii TaxID=3476 RepID=A0A2P5E547_PARAD|nr:UDP-glucuronosyl/UDP-glucosyltransferase [Parasponia andersonii]
MESSSSTMHIAMYPWFAFGHITPFLHLSNKLAQRGHRVSFLIPPKTESKIRHLNLLPDLITFYPITFPHVDGLPSGVETTNDVPVSSISHIAMAMDKTQADIQLLLRDLKPDFVLFDFAYWIPKLARPLGIISLHYSVVSPAATAYNASTSSHLHSLSGRQVSEADLMKPPPGYPDLPIYLHLHEARDYLMMTTLKLGSVTLFDRLFMSLSECEAIAVKGCREIDGPFVDYLKEDFGKPLLLTGPLIPDLQASPLEQKWVDFLGRFKPGSVIYCGFGSEVILTKGQFQELVLGLELSGFAFLAALRTPVGAESMDEALPDGFSERVGGRGVVHEGWIQQPQILKHPSVGCNVTHCGWGSLFEALMRKCQLVLIPNRGDQIYNARLMANTFKAGIEVEKGEEDGLFTRESVCKAIKTVMEEDTEVGKEVRANRAKLQELISHEEFDSSYIDGFIHELRTLLK